MPWSRSIALALWLLLMAVATGVLWPQGRGLPLETNVLALLPAAEQDPVAAHATTQANEALARQHLLLVGADTPAAAIAAATPLLQALQHSTAFAGVQARIDSQRGEALARFYNPYRNGLLSPPLQAALQDGAHARITQHALETLHSPGSAVSSNLLRHDPLLLFSDFLGALGNQAPAVYIDSGYAFARHDGRHYLLAVLELPGSPFALPVQQRVLPVLDAALAAARAQSPQADILDTGVLRFAAAGVDSARQEISTIGLGSMAGVLLLFLWVFRSPTPLLLTLLPLACGFAVALAACLLAFGRVHLMTLVFGTSLIGLAVDYSLHFFVDRQASAVGWQAGDTLRRIGPGLVLGLLTSTAGFGALCLAPFPGMQQMALFCSTGLFTAFLTVTGVLPLLVRRPRTADPLAGLALASRLLALWQSRLPTGLVLAAMVLYAAGGLARLHTNDDIRLLQGKPPALVATEQRARTITGQQGGGQFLLVEGDTPEQMLQHSEAVLTALQAHAAAGTLAGFDSISRWLPSQARQQATASGLAALAASPAAAEYAAGLGLDPLLLAQYARPTPVLLPAAWLADAVSLPWRKLWLGETGRGYATMVPLHGVRDAAPLQALARQYPGVRWVDPVSDISQLLTTYRERASGIVLAAYGLVFAGLALRYRPRRALRALLPAALAASVALASVGWLGEPLTVFHLLALLLVLGFGIDYSLFLVESREHPQATMLAVVLSALTTLLSFGLLALSNTPAIHAFGIVVLTGITVALVFAPLARPTPLEV